MKKLIALLLVATLTMSFVACSNENTEEKSAEKGKTSQTDIKTEEIEMNVTDSGTCGEKLTWKYDESTGLLFISGTGAMENFDDESPWANYKNNIKKVVIDNGVTTIGKAAFWECISLTSVTIPNSVTRINYQAFSYCDSLTSITIPDSVTTIGSYVFYNCFNLTSITIPDSVTKIGTYTFTDCDNLTDVYYSGTEEQWNKLSIDRYNENLINATIHYNQ